MAPLISVFPDDDNLYNLKTKPMAKLKTYRVINSQEVWQEYHQIVKATSEAKAIEKAQDIGDWGEPVEESCNGDCEYEAEEIEDED